MYQLIVNGNYLNFAILDYYQDSTFADLTSLVLDMLGSLPQGEMKTYQKVQVQCHNMLWTFFNNHLEMLFLKSSGQQTASIIDLLVKGMSE